MGQNEHDAFAWSCATRRALAEDEQRLLITATALSSRAANRTASERDSSIDVQGRSNRFKRWLATGSGARNKKTTPKPIGNDLLDDLSKFTAGRSDDENAVHLPRPDAMAAMLQSDCKHAGIDTEGVDFHALRHTFGTTLARQGVYPKTLMSMMDHTRLI